LFNSVFIANSQFSHYIVNTIIAVVDTEFVSKHFINLCKQPIRLLFHMCDYWLTLQPIISQSIKSHFYSAACPKQIRGSWWQNPG